MDAAVTWRFDDLLVGDVSESGGRVVCVSRGNGAYTATLNVALNHNIAGDLANIGFALFGGQLNAPTFELTVSGVAECSSVSGGSEPTTTPGATGSLIESVTTGVVGEDYQVTVELSQPVAGVSSELFERFTVMLTTAAGDTFGLIYGSEGGSPYVASSFCVASSPSCEPPGIVPLRVDVSAAGSVLTYSIPDDSFLDPAGLAANVFHEIGASRETASRTDYADGLRVPFDCCR